MCRPNIKHHATQCNYVWSNYKKVPDQKRKIITTNKQLQAIELETYTEINKMKQNQKKAKLLSSKLLKQLLKQNKAKIK